jgi:flagellar biosynthesis/type III secretory pathway protein FliH
MEELTINITYNGMKYYSAEAIAEQQTAWYDRGKKEGFEEGKKANGYSVDDIKQLHTDYSHIHHLWFDKGYNTGKSAGYSDGYNDGYEQCKHDGISPKEIPGEYLSHIEEAYDDGYKEGYTDCREVAKMLNKYGIDDEDGVAE